jgi:ribosome-associated protein
MNQAQTQPASAGAATPPIAAEPGSLHALVLNSLDDHMVIASGRSTRQVTAMAQKLAERIKHAGFAPARIEGLPAADWVLVDAGDIVVHLFRPEVRSFYNLERMWAFGDASVAGAA